MPYIHSERRKAIINDSHIDHNSTIMTPGELNYYITTVIIEYFKYHGASYQTINDISGAMTECLAEFRRRIVVPYEKKKIKQNGDCYDQVKK
jgi:hypothetical protein